MMQMFKTLDGETKVLWELTNCTYQDMYKLYMDTHFKGGYIGDIIIVFCGKKIPYSDEPIPPSFFKESPCHVILKTTRTISRMEADNIWPEQLNFFFQKRAEIKGLLKDDTLTQGERKELRGIMNENVPMVSKINFLNRVRVALKMAPDSVPDEPLPDVDMGKLKLLYQQFEAAPEEQFGPLSEYVARFDLVESIKK